MPQKDFHSMEIINHIFELGSETNNCHNVLLYKYFLKKITKANG